MARKMRKPVSWEYRVLCRQCKETGRDEYVIIEVNYGPDGKIFNWTETECAPMGDSLEALGVDLKDMMAAMKKPRMVEVVESPKRARLVELG
jgi:hypothetical protein